MKKEDIKIGQRIRFINTDPLNAKYFKQVATIISFDLDPYFIVRWDNISGCTNWSKVEWFEIYTPDDMS